MPISKYLAARQVCKKRYLLGQGKEQKSKRLRQKIILTRTTMPNLSSFWTASSTSKLQLTPNSSFSNSSHRRSRSYTILRIMEDYLSNTVIEGHHGSMHQRKAPDKIHMNAKHAVRDTCVIYLQSSFTLFHQNEKWNNNFLYLQIWHGHHKHQL